MKNTSKKLVGVIGAGSFGTALANIIAENTEVLLMARRKEVADEIRSTGQYKGQKMHERISVTTNSEEVAERCDLIFPVVPSTAFAEMIQEISPFLHPYHIMIHATKGLDVTLPANCTLEMIETLNRDEVKTMSELITQKTVIRRVGCVAGPNLAFEIAEGQPAATVVASPFEEVIREGSAALRTSRFRVHASHDLLGIELAGVLKNIMAIASGILAGLGYGDNTRALLITRGLAEMTTIGKGLGADPRAFLGLAGVGDLVATCNSPHSRNYTLGYRLAKGESLAEVIASMEETAEGVKTICITRALAANYKLPALITQALHRVMYGDMEISRGMQLLMEYPFRADVEFI